MSEKLAKIKWHQINSVSNFNFRMQKQPGVALGRDQFILIENYEAASGGLNVLNAPPEFCVSCDCSQIWPGQIICQDNFCLAFKLGVECLPSKCNPVFCGNQQFQKHDYGHVECYQTKNMGLGLKLTADVLKI